MDRPDYIPVKRFHMDGYELTPDNDAYYQARERRRITYNIAEQLARLSDDIEAGLFGEAAKTGQFIEYVRSVKASIPKPAKE
jgi:hypothetical protein